MTRVLWAAVALIVLGLAWGTFRGARLDRKLAAAESERDRMVALAEERQDSLTAQRARWEQREIALERQLAAQAAEIRNLIADVPEAPSTPDVRIALDSLATSPEVRALITQTVEPVLAQRDSLLAIVRGEPERMAARDRLWQMRLENERELRISAEEQILVERTARRAEAAVAERLRAKLGTSRWETLLCGAGGGLAGASVADPQVAGAALGALAGIGACQLWRR